MVSKANPTIYLYHKAKSTELTYEEIVQIYISDIYINNNEVNFPSYAEVGDHNKIAFNFSKLPALFHKLELNPYELINKHQKNYIIFLKLSLIKNLISLTIIL